MSDEKSTYLIDPYREYSDRELLKFALKMLERARDEQLSEIDRTHFWLTNNPMFSNIEKQCLK